ncbi:putative ribonuclease H-like domain-containing protein [Tanacetum coccineum]|uniref:Ribonuclease H-like domain-containing protein n=1 Tax=Tanacetum coccineum TaxID=301880 RepID=A0ABQ5JDL4_9ASTR
MTPSSPPSYTFLDTQRSPLLTSLASKLPNPSTNIPHQTSIPTAPPITDPTQSPPHTGPNSPGPTCPTNQPTSHEPNNIQTQTQNNPLPPPIFDPPNPQTNTNPVNEPPRTHPMITRSQSGIVKPIERLSLHTSSLSPIPKSPFIALKDPNWCNAMYDEYNALVKNGTWILVPRPSDVNLVRSMWLFKHKFHADGTLSRYKARLVANGSNQQHGVDFDETFSPVVKPTTIRTVLSLAVSRQWPIHQLDVKNAFLNGDLSKTVYMHQPPGFVDSRYPNHVCLLQRSLYGLKQAPRAWFQRFAGYATRAGFSPSRCDSSLFIYTQGSQVAYLLIYVDDIILTASSLVLLQHIVDSLHKEFDMTDLGALNYFLGISIVRHPIGLFLSQKKYARQLLEQAHMVNCNPSRTPVDTDSKLGPNGVPVQDPSLYRSLAGGLWYLTFTRPNLSYAVQQLYASATTSLVGYTNADWAGFPSTCRPTSGYCMFLGDNLLSWSAKRQHTISCSSVKAEYQGVANVVVETVCIRNLLRELHSPILTATLVYCDNISAVYMSANPVQHQRTKHIEIDIHFVCDMVKAGHVQVLHVPSHFQYVDIFTKGLPLALFEDFCSSLSGSGVNTARLRQTVNTIRPKAAVNVVRPRVAINTARPKAVLNVVKGNMVNVVKASTYWVWRPKQKVLDHGNPEQDLQERGIFDSGCSRHMTGNKSYLTDFEEIDGGFVAFGGNSRGGKITGKGKIRTGNLDFDDVYFVKELKFNLLSVSQMCDKKNSVLFNDTECFVLSSDLKLADENHVLLKVPKKDNMYSVDLKNIAPKGGLTCLYAKDTSDESNLWHRRLRHINFKTSNKLKGNLVSGLPSKLFEINQTYIACQKGKQHRASCKSKAAKAVNAACYVHNRVLVIKPHKKTPYELFLGRKPSLGFMRTFRCPITILNTIDHLGKFDGKVDEGFFVGYSFNSKALRVFNNRTRIVEDNLHVKFNENTPNIAGSGPNWLFDIDALTKTMNYQPVVAGNQTNGSVGTKSSNDAGKPRVETKEDDVNSTNTVNAASTNEDNVVGAKTSIELPDDPNMPPLEEIIYSDDDEDVGAEADMTNLDTHIPISPILTTRIHKDHPLDQARLVTQGHTLEEGIDYDEVFAPVARIEAIRLFLAYASYIGFVVYQMDVKSAFLYDTIEEEVYVCQPPGFEDPEFPNKVYKVEKALYGLHQAPRAWYETLSTYLLENRFKRGTIDKTLFIKKDKSDILLVQVYVDDIIFGSTKKSLCTEFEDMMHKRFQMSSMGKLTFFLGLQVKQKEDGIFISQDKCVADILKKFDISTVKTASTPMETNKALLKDVEADDVDVHLYRSMIGSLMYLTTSRPDIMFVVCACARFQVTPKVSHLHAVKRIFRYLKGQPKLGLWYHKDSPLDLEAFSNSDYAGASLDRKSTIGAGYVAAANCCGQVLWIQNQLLNYGYNFMNTKIFIDNKRTICVVKNPIFHSKTKHIEIRHHFIKDSYENKLIQVIKIHTDLNVVDLLTKAFNVGRFQFLTDMGEGSGQPTDPQHTFTSAQPSNEEQITASSSFHLKKTYKHRKPKKVTKIPQSSEPTNLVADDAVYEEIYDRVERAATTATSLDTEQDSGVNTPRSDEDKIEFKELMEICTKLSEMSELNWEKVKTDRENVNLMMEKLIGMELKFLLLLQVNAARQRLTAAAS